MNNEKSVAKELVKNYKNVLTKKYKKQKLLFAIFSTLMLLLNLGIMSTASIILIKIFYFHKDESWGISKIVSILIAFFSLTTFVLTILISISKYKFKTSIYLKAYTSIDMLMVKFNNSKNYAIEEFEKDIDVVYTKALNFKHPKISSTKIAFKTIAKA